MIPNNEQNFILNEELANSPFFTRLSESGKKIVTSYNIDKNIRVIAGAGSGKTETMTLRIINLLLTGKAKPKEVVAFTFTEKAAQSLKSRIYLRIRELEKFDILRNLNEMYVGTIHAYCLRLLHDHYNLGNYSVLNEITEKIYIQSHAYSLGFSNYVKDFRQKYNLDKDTKFLERCKMFLQSYNIIYNDELIDDDNFRNNPLISKFLEKVEKYEQELEKDKLITFNLLIYRAIKELEKDRTPIEDLKFLFVDEYQDINLSQEHLIRILGQNAQVFVVGDPKQSIYHWRGSSFMCFNNFKNLFRPKETIDFFIPENWRSLNNIVKVSNIFANNLRINDIHMTSKSMRSKANGLVAKAILEDQEAEADFIINQIKYLVKEAKICEYKDIAILFRSVKTSAKVLIEKCNQNEIPYIIGGKVGLFNRKEIEAITYFFEYLGSNNTNKENKYLNTGAKLWMESLNQNKIDMDYDLEDLKELIENWAISTLDDMNSMFSKIKIKEFESEVWGNKDAENELLNITYELDNSRNEGEYDFKDKSSGVGIRKLLNYKDYMNGNTFVDYYYNLLNMLGIKKLDYKNNLHASFLANLGQFSQILNEYEFTKKIGGSGFEPLREIKSLLMFLRNYPDLFEEMPGFDLRFLNAVRIYTIHQAKGLEWPIVFIPSVISKRFPTSNLDKKPHNFLSIKNGGDKSSETQYLYDVDRYMTKIEDEARLMYVALTRARDVLIISKFEKYTPPQSRINGKRKSTSESILFSRIDLPNDEVNIIRNSGANIADLGDFPKSVFHRGEVANEEEFQEFNVSEILDYDQCSYLYLLRHIWNFGPHLNRFVGYGLGMHFILRVMIEQYLKNLKDEDEIGRKIDELVEKQFKLRYLSPAITDKIKGGVAKTLKNYVIKYKDELKKMESVEARLELIEERAIIKGIADIIIDSLDTNNDANGNDKKAYHIRDYKTQQMNKEELHKFQILLYAAAFEYMGNPVNKGSIGYLKEQINKKFQIEQSAIKRAKKRAKKYVGYIKRNIFESNVAAKAETKRIRCENCDYKEICRFNEEYRT